MPPPFRPAKRRRTSPPSLRSPGQRNPSMPRPSGQRSVAGHAPPKPVFFGGVWGMQTPRREPEAVRLGTASGERSKYAPPDTPKKGAGTRETSDPRSPHSDGGTHSIHHVIMVPPRNCAMQEQLLWNSQKLFASAIFSSGHRRLCPLPKALSARFGRGESSSKGETKAG